MQGAGSECQTGYPAAAGCAPHERKAHCRVEREANAAAAKLDVGLVIRIERNAHAVVMHELRVGSFDAILPTVTEEHLLICCQVAAVQ